MADFTLLNEENTYLQLLKESARGGKLIREEGDPTKIKVEHPGVLEVPEGKNVEDLGMDHFKALIRKKGWGEISKALINLVRWNENKNKPLSNWADSMQSKLSKWVDSERESGALKEDVNVKAEHTGVLEVPEGKNVEDLGIEHFKALVNKKGWGEISRALINLVRWNENKNKSLSNWADSMHTRLHNWVEKEKK